VPITAVAACPTWYDTPSVTVTIAKLRRNPQDALLANTTMFKAREVCKSQQAQLLMLQYGISKSDCHSNSARLFGNALSE
jgi:hypothetical protein